MKISSLYEEVSTQQLIYRRIVSVDWKNTDEDIIELLQKLGFEKRGSGYYGRAYVSPLTSFVVKIFTNEDRNYLKYVTDYVKKNRNNPHLPRIYKVIPDVGSGESMVIMEKLYHLSDNEMQSKLIAMIEYFGDLGKYNPKWFTKEGIRYFMNKSHINKIIDDFPLLAMAIVDMAKIFGTTYTDMHYGNIMKRDDGTLVLTDPVRSELKR